MLANYSGKYDNYGSDKRILPKGTLGFFIYTLIMVAMAMLLPDMAIDANGDQIIIVVGFLAIWRYSWGLLHFIRSLIYRHIIFPRYRARASKNIDELMPSKIYLMVTSFRIQSETAIRSFRAAISEAINCGVPTTVVASIVELADERLVIEMFNSMNVPDRVELHIVRVPGSGKRDGLAQAFRAISRDLPPPDAIVAVIDGDTILLEGCVRRSVPFFKSIPNLGGITTDEDCEVKAEGFIKSWLSFRFAQRHISMASWSLSKKLSTLTGRMSMFRADIISDPEFINEVQDDHVEHWRFGRLKFLTGDDKSSCFHLIKKKFDLLYLPDVLVKTIEHPPSPSFIKSSTILMMRWSGNMLRTNSRLLSLGPRTTGFFIWWCLMDQRISMWTALTGPVFVVFMVMKYSVNFIYIYIVWIALTRWIMSLMLLSSRPILDWKYPFAMYFAQIYGSMIKTYVLFRLNIQSWTRQKIKLKTSKGLGDDALTALCSNLFHIISIVCFIAVVGYLSGAFKLPEGIFSLKKHYFDILE